jgi:hypothetical protein
LSISTGQPNLPAKASLRCNRVVQLAARAAPFRRVARAAESLEILAWELVSDEPAVEPVLADLGALLPAVTVHVVNYEPVTRATARALPAVVIKDDLALSSATLPMPLAGSGVALGTPLPSARNAPRSVVASLRPPVEYG